MTDPLQSAWARLTAQMTLAGRRIDALTEVRDSAERAEGYRFLTRVMSTMIEFQMEKAEEWPTLAQVMFSTRKFYADNPDTLYHRAPLNPRLGYRVYGQRGNELYLAFCVYGPNRILANLYDEEMVFDANGRFEPVLSAQRPQDCVNWLPLGNAAHTLVTRQYFTEQHWSPAQLNIALLEPSAPPLLSTEQMMARRLFGLGESITRMLQTTELASTDWLQRPNQVTIDSTVNSLANLFATPDNQYVGGWYRLADDEMLVMEGIAPTCRYWSVQLYSRWLESQDYLNRQVILNHTQVRLEADRSFRIAVAARNPGLPNWLDTGGNREGGVILRWLLPEGDTQHPTFRVEKLPAFSPKLP